MRRLRHKLGLRLEDAAAELGCSVSHLSRVERGVRTGNADLAGRYRIYLDGMFRERAIDILEEMGTASRTTPA